jgi:methionine aminotransferase
MSSERTPAFPSRLPAVGTTIFTVMSALAASTRRSTWARAFPTSAATPS